MKLFLNHEVEDILQIPLNPFLPQDMLFWHHTKNRMHIVKLGYNVGIEFLANNLMTQSTSDLRKDSKLWHLIHDLPIQSKICMFLLEVASNILPTRRNLVRRGIFDNVACIPCGFAVEDDGYAFLTLGL